MMRNRNLLVLSLVTLVVLIAAMISSQNRAPQTEIERPLLFPDLAARVNDITDIVIESGETSIHVSRLADNWVVEEAHNYPARFDKIKKLVLATAEMRLLAERTRNPSLYPELGVEPADGANPGSHLLTLKDAAGNTLASVIVGKERKSAAPGGSRGLYVRKPDSDQALLVEGEVTVSTMVRDWIERDLINVSNDRISRVSLTYTDETSLVLTRGKGENDFSIEEIPDGKDAESAFIVNQMGTFLSNLTIDNVRARESFTFPEPQTTTTITTYDGLVATIVSATADGIHYASLEFSVDESIITAGAVESQQQESSEGENTDIRQEAADLNSKVANWVYIIPDYKYRALVKQADELMKDIEAKDQQETES